MKVKVIIAEAFQVAAAGIEEVETNGQTIRECLQEAVERAPGLRKIWFTREGELSKYVILTMNGENVPSKDFDKKVKEGDEIFPILLIGGG
jgi:molybdopterin converting factor small subunit